MADNTPFVGDTGTRIEVDVGVNADDITLARLIVRKSNGTTAQWTATPVTGTQKVRYITNAGDFDVAGVYQLQAYIETNDWKGYGTICEFIVSQHL